MNSSRWISAAMDLRNKFILFTASGAGAGYFPLFPGTIGTLVAIPISLALNRLASVAVWPALLALLLAAFWPVAIATRTSQIFPQKKPALIVINGRGGFLVANFYAAERPTP